MYGLRSASEPSCGLSDLNKNDVDGPGID